MSDGASVAMVDFGTVDVLGPNSLSGPRDRASGSIPLYIAEGGWARRLLLLSGDVVEKNFIGSVIRPQVAGINTPV